MPLNAHEAIAIVQVVLYLPILVLSLARSFRKLPERRMGWVMLAVLSVGTR